MNFAQPVNPKRHKATGRVDAGYTCFITQAVSDREGRAGGGIKRQWAKTARDDHSSLSNFNNSVISNSQIQARATKGKGRLTHWTMGDKSGTVCC